MSPRAHQAHVAVGGVRTVSCMASGEVQPVVLSCRSQLRDDAQATAPPPEPAASASPLVAAAEGLVPRQLVAAAPAAAAAVAVVNATAAAVVAATVLAAVSAVPDLAQAVSASVHVAPLVPAAEAPRWSVR